MGVRWVRWVGLVGVAGGSVGRVEGGWKEGLGVGLRAWDERKRNKSCRHMQVRVGVHV